VHRPVTAVGGAQVLAFEPERGQVLQLCWYDNQGHNYHDRHEEFTRPCVWCNVSVANS